MKICQLYNKPYGRYWYEHKPQKVAETEIATLLCDFSIHTEKTIQESTPDITIKDHKGKIFLTF